MAKPSVLIVDRSAETREVLRTALSDNALVLEASGANAGLELLCRHQPDVIVLDMDLAQAAAEPVRTALCDSTRTPAPIVMLGKASKSSLAASAGEFSSAQCVAKPYHYGPLIRKIERLLDEARQRFAA